MRRIQLAVVVLVGLGLLTTGAIYARQAEKATGPEIGKLLKEANFSLATAIAAAEKETKGVAVRAWAEKYADGPRVDVHVAIGDQVKWLEVDKTGKVLFTKDVPEGKPHKDRKDKGGEKPEKPAKP
jgi:hypothetical protein